MRCSVGIQREIEMNKKLYLVNGKPMTYGELIIYTHDCGLNTPDSQLALEHLRKREHTAVVRKWNRKAGCYADEMEGADV